MITNLLNVALQAIRPTPVVYRKFLGNVMNGTIKQISYAEPITISNAIAQPMKNETYKDLGLDFQKEYFKVFLETDAIALEEKNASPDKLEFNGKSWIVVKTKRWFLYDGWTEVFCIAEKDYAK